MKYRRPLPVDEMFAVRPDDPDRAGEHNYQKEFRRLVRAGVLKTGEISLINVVHDDWCAIYGGSVCDCNPDILDRGTGKVLNPRPAKKTSKKGSPK
jgi:hypothetical protein